MDDAPSLAQEPHIDVLREAFSKTLSQHDPVVQAAVRARVSEGMSDTNIARLYNTSAQRVYEARRSGQIPSGKSGSIPNKVKNRSPRRKGVRLPAPLSSAAAEMDGLPPKKCNSCGRLFRREHKFNFICGTCKDSEVYHGIFGR